MQWIPCSVAQWIPIECSEFHEARLNAVDSMQSGALFYGCGEQLDLRSLLLVALASTGFHAGV